MKNPYGDKLPDTELVQYKNYDIELIKTHIGYEAFLRRRGEPKSNLGNTNINTKENVLKDAKRRIDIQLFF